MLNDITEQWARKWRNSPQKQSFAEQLTDKHKLMGAQEFSWKVQASQRAEHSRIDAERW